MDLQKLSAEFFKINTISPVHYIEPQVVCKQKKLSSKLTDEVRIK